MTRTLAIIPITLGLAFMRTKKEHTSGKNVNLKKIFPMFILWFVAASLITTICTNFGIPASFFSPMKNMSKFLIIMAMGAIGLNTDIVKLVKSGAKPIFMGFACWTSISIVSLVMQHIMGIW